MGYGSPETRLVRPPHTARLHLLPIEDLGSVHSSDQRSIMIVVGFANTPIGVECRGQAQNLNEFLEAI
jgi:hypothetical protein